jgi:hypothetical protein
MNIWRGLKFIKVWAIRFCSSTLVDYCAEVSFLGATCFFPDPRFFWPFFPLALLSETSFILTSSFFFAAELFLLFYVASWITG